MLPIHPELHLHWNASPSTEHLPLTHGDDEHGPLSRAELIELVRLTHAVYLKRCSVLGESHPRTLKAEESLERYELALQVAPIDHSVLGQSVVGDESSPRGPARTGGFF